MIVDIVNANNKPYVTVGDHSLSQVEYDYYFNSTVSNYLNTYSSFLSYMGLDTSVPYDEQQYSEDMTWQEYFEQSTVEQMKREFALLDDAAKNGFEYDTTDDYNSFLEQAKSAADTDKVSLQAYYKTMFGQYATAKTLKTTSGILTLPMLTIRSFWKTTSHPMMRLLPIIMTTRLIMISSLIIHSLSPLPIMKTVPNRSKLWQKK